MICPIFMPISHPREQQIVEQALIERYNFCCEALHPIPFTHLNHGDAYTILHQEPRVRNRRVISYYRQYVHRSLSCYVRMTQTGLVWISNRKLTCDEIQEIFDGLRQLVNSVGIAHAALADVVERIFETRAAAAEVVLSTPAPEATTPITNAKPSNRDVVVDAEDREEQGEYDLGSEGDKTETNTTDEDNERSHGSCSSDDDKENAAPVVAVNKMRGLVSTAPTTPPIGDASDVDTLETSQAAMTRSREPRKSATAVPNPVTTVAPMLTNGSEHSFSAPAGDLIAAAAVVTVTTTATIDAATDPDASSKLQTQQDAADTVAVLEDDQHELQSEQELPAMQRGTSEDNLSEWR